MKALLLALSLVSCSTLDGKVRINPDEIKPFAEVLKLADAHVQKMPEGIERDVSAEDVEVCRLWYAQIANVAEAELRAGAAIQESQDELSEQAREALRRQAEDMEGSLRGGDLHQSDLGEFELELEHVGGALDQVAPGDH